jgi:hypothetical protein
MRAQLTYLIHISGRPGIFVQIMPFRSGRPPSRGRLIHHLAARGPVAIDHAQALPNGWIPRFAHA